MAELAAAGSPEEAVTRAVEEQAFYHEAALNAAWTGARLAIGGLSFLFGAVAVAYFYLQSANSHQMWLPSSTTPPHMYYGALITGLIAASAIVQTAGLLPYDYESTETPYTRHGDWFAWSCFALGFLMSAVSLAHRRL